MKKLLFITLLVGVALASFYMGGRSARTKVSKSESNSTSDRKVLYYVDPMNPAHTSDRPGKAPCGMDMEPVYADTGSAGTPHGAPQSVPSAIRVGQEKQQLIGLRVAPAVRKPMVSRLRLTGKVAVDETRIYRINATVDGWITKTLPFASGSYVKKNETLAGFYSPEFLSAGQALLFALSSMDRVKAQTTGAESAGQQAQINQFNLNLRQYQDSLKNLGMGDLQIQEIISTRKYMENVNITSPADGFILVRNVSEGQRFDKGTELYKIADLSQVWIMVDVFEKDASMIAPNEPLKVTLPNQSKTFTAKVSNSLAQFDNVSRTLKLRLEADNPEIVLKPDMFVDVELPVSLPETVVVPSEAIIDAGMRHTVYVDRGNGYFEARDVELGSRVGDQVQVLAGLKGDERIVTSGNFLLDSESRMKMAAAGMLAAPSSDPVCGMAVDESAARAAKRSSDYQGKTYYFCSDGCKKKFDADPAKSLAKVMARPAPSTVAAPVAAIDPVCKMNVEQADAEAAKLTAEHQGKTYYFCNPSCKKKFQDDPAKYLSAAGTKTEMSEMKHEDAGPAHAH